MKPKRAKKRKNYISHRPIPKNHSPMAVMKKAFNPPGSVYCGDFKFKCGHSVPIFEITNVHNLNQAIGYAKFMNRSYGDVYYRGECKLHESLLPSIYRGHTSTSVVAPLNALIKRIADDKKMINQVKLDISDMESAKYKIEGMLQHYGIKTRFIDVVDNHWVALWMGLNRAQKSKQVLEYIHYEQREIPLVDFANGRACAEDDLFQYILLIAVPGQSERINNGIYVSDDFIEIDLRQALPSTYIRPHAQHGLVIKKISHSGENVDNYDLATNVVGILKIRIDRAKQWIGSGDLMSQENLFPAPAYDNGYDVLLNRDDLFNTDQFTIARYI